MKIDDLIAKITDLISQDPAKAVVILSSWLQQPANKLTIRKTG